MILEVISFLGFYVSLFVIHTVLEEKAMERRYNRKIRAREYMEVVY